MITLILSETNRSLTYLEYIFKSKIKFQRIILYSKNIGKVYKFIINKKLFNYLVFIKTDNINSKLLEKKINISESKIYIISTYPGEIITNKLLFRYKLIHCHPGNLPMFKGSTTIYYSILLKKKICVTIFEMNKKIDSGKILYKKYFELPQKLGDIEKQFDNKIRALTLIDFLMKIEKYKYKYKYKYIKSKKNYHHYYIAHPIVRQIVLNKNYLK